MLEHSARGHGQLRRYGNLPALTVGLASMASCSASGTDVVTTPGPLVAGAGPLECVVSEPIDQVIDVGSIVFGSADRVSVHFTPCTIDQPTPNAIVYLLHGASADETQWPDVGIFDAADAAVMNGTMPPSILVAPNAAAAYSCTDCVDDLLIHLVDEIESTIERIAPVDSNRRVIGGISRGGGLALQVAGSAPSCFRAVGAHSSVDAPDSTLAEIAESGLHVRFDVGDDDDLAARSEYMAAVIDDRGGNADIVVAHGAHDRRYWRSQADSYIDFYASSLGSAPPSSSLTGRVRCSP